MTFTGRLRKLLENVPTMTDAELLAAHNDLNKTAVVLYYGAPDRVLNLCNECIEAVRKEQDRRRNGNAAAVAEMAAAVAEIKAAAVALKNATGKFAAVIHSGDVSDVVTVRKTVAETAYRCVADVRGVPVDCVKIFVSPPAPVGRDNLPPCASPCGDGTGGETKRKPRT